MSYFSQCRRDADAEMLSGDDLAIYESGCWRCRCHQCDIKYFPQRMGYDGEFDDGRAEREGLGPS